MLEAQARLIEAAFAAPTREGVLSALDDSAGPLAAQAARAMRQKSPRSQEIALRQIAAAADMTLPRNAAAGLPHRLAHWP